MKPARQLSGLFYCPQKVMQPLPSLDDWRRTLRVRNRIRKAAQPASDEGDIALALLLRSVSDSVLPDHPGADDMTVHRRTRGDRRLNRRAREDARRWFLSGEFASWAEIAGVKPDYVSLWLRKELPWAQAMPEIS